MNFRRISSRIFLYFLIAFFSINTLVPANSMLANAASKATIKSISPINTTVNQGDAFNLPTTVKANMSDGTVKDVSVVWSPRSASTSKVGTFIFNGTVSGYSSAVTLTLSVKAKISSIKNLTVSIGQNTQYSLPSTVSATMSDGTTASVAVTWSPSTVDTSKTGTFTYSGTVQGL